MPAARTSARYTRGREIALEMFAALGLPKLLAEPPKRVGHLGRWSWLFAHGSSHRAAARTRSLLFKRLSAREARALTTSWETPSTFAISR